MAREIAYDPSFFIKMVYVFLLSFELAELLLDFLVVFEDFGDLVEVCLDDGLCK